MHKMRFSKDNKTIIIIKCSFCKWMKITDHFQCEKDAMMSDDCPFYEEVSSPYQRINELMNYFPDT